MRNDMFMFKLLYFYGNMKKKKKIFYKTYKSFELDSTDFLNVYMYIIYLLPKLLRIKLIYFT